MHSSTILLLICISVSHQQQMNFNMVRELIESQRTKTANAYLHTSPSIAPHPPSKINELTDFFRSVAAVLAALTGLLSVVAPCWIICRCVRNGGHLKKTWFYPKTFDEYRRRREVARSRTIALDRLGTMPTEIYSLA